MTDVTTISLRAYADDRNVELLDNERAMLRGAADVIDDLCKQIDGSVRVAADALARAKTAHADGLAEAAKITALTAEHAASRIHEDGSPLDFRQKIRFETANQIGEAINAARRDCLQKAGGAQ